jgi:hypothetical protein
MRLTVTYLSFDDGMFHPDLDLGRNHHVASNESPPQLHPARASRMRRYRLIYRQGAAAQWYFADLGQGTFKDELLGVFIP